MAENPSDRKSSLLLGALGVVYGDLGTSPLYAVRTATGALNGTVSREMALGILSLIVWTLIITLSVKYCLLVLRADNQGEGGTLALMSLVKANKLKGGRWWLAALGLFGAALLYGDGIITPAISVLSALEGLNVATPAVQPFILPAAVAVLVALFVVQAFGTAKIGLAFGPVMAIWFVILAVLGVTNIVRHPGVLAGLNPLYAFDLLKRLTWHAGPVLGGVFLCVTGGEAMYADIGHFGRRAIRLDWYGLVLPALILNYAGQVGEVMDGHAPANPFFQMAPHWALYPLVILATLATIIASQAIISGVFSLTRQAMHLSWFPGVTVQQTSEDRYGQVYVPLVNWLMMLGTVALTLGFRSSERLSGAYGLAVSGTMLITTILAASCMRRIWHWRPAIVVPLVALFLAIDLIYFAANLTKLTQGGWIPLLIAILLFHLMTVWRAGLDALHHRMRGANCETCLSLLRRKKIPRVPGTAIFLTRQRHDVPALLSQHIEHMGALQEHVITLTVTPTGKPWIADDARATVRNLGQGLWRVSVRFGFLEQRALLAVLKNIAQLKDMDLDNVVWFGARDLVVRDPLRPRLNRIDLAIFAFLLRNAVKTMDHFAIPPKNFVEVAREIRL